MPDPTSPEAATAAGPAVDASDPGAVTGRTLSSPHNFCPQMGMLGGKDSQWNARTAGLLHTRLKALGLVIAGGMTVGLGRDLFIDLGFSLVFPNIIWATMVAAVAYLWWEKNPPLIKLRVFEVWFFAAPAAMLLYLDRMLILQSAQAGDPGLMLMNWHRTEIHMGALIAGYAMFMPASWKRTLAVTAPMSIAPFALGAIMIRNLPEVAAAAQQALTFEIWSAAVIMMTVFVAIAAYGTYVIDSYRQQTAEMGYAGQYHLEKKIGSGGMGEVWLARHNLLSRPAAIKVIRPEMLGNGGGVKTEAAGTAILRFKREAEKTASLTSSHTINLYDFGTADDGSFYYVIEYLSGLDFDTLVEDHGPVPVERAVHLLTQACESLADAHEHGMVHRDIKPANLFATRQGITNDFVKVLDFGLVKDTDPDEAATKLTQEGMTSGTPAFMPPEIALAKADVDARADIYALGCVGYWLATGQYVFASSSPVEMVVDHVKSAPPAPSTRTELPIPTQFDDVILRTLAKDPQMRFQSMREFAAALCEVPLQGEWTDARAAEWWRLHPGGAAGGAADEPSTRSLT